MIANILVIVLFTGDGGKIYHEKKSTLNVGSSKVMLESFSMEYTQQAFIPVLSSGRGVDVSCGQTRGAFWFLFVNWFFTTES